MDLERMVSRAGDWAFKGPPSKLINNEGTLYIKYHRETSGISFSAPLNAMSN